ncbi:MAG: RelA/SpoT domain-containing protein [Bdellovibrionales bacterium]|nr:RelA/SpoT domain-containing protein [Bdellovibrionales bacterium]
MNLAGPGFSKTKIDRAGELLKSRAGSSDEISHALEVLSSWRAYHAVPLDTFATMLRKRIPKVSKDAIVAQRLKRTPSILLKLSNHKTMRLSAMQDIGGLRAILESTEEVYKLLDVYKKAKSKHSLASLDDYIASPKTDGYRGVHLVYKLAKEPNLFLEIPKLDPNCSTSGQQASKCLVLCRIAHLNPDTEMKMARFFAFKFDLRHQKGQPILKAHVKLKSDLVAEVKNKSRNYM